jgi:DNA repair protein RadA/Sms
MGDPSESEFQLSTKPCADCGLPFPVEKYMCPHCGLWNTQLTEEETETLSRASRASNDDGPPDLKFTALSKIEGTDAQRTSTGPWDPCFGDGVVNVSSTILAGKRGCGKSTLIIQAMDALLKEDYKKAVYVYAEGAPSTVRDYARRLKVRHSGRIIVPEYESVWDLIRYLETTEDRYPIAFDSVSAITNDHRARSIELAKAAKSHAMRNRAPVFLLMHVNKEGDIAGVETLQHEVDTIIKINPVLLKKEPTAFRRVVTDKNRFGPTLTITLEMKPHGLFEASEDDIPTKKKKRE